MSNQENIFDASGLSIADIEKILKDKKAEGKKTKLPSASQLNATLSYQAETNPILEALLRAAIIAESMSFNTEKGADTEREKLEKSLAKARSNVRRHEQALTSHDQIQEHGGLTRYCTNLKNHLILVQQGEEADLRILEQGSDEASVAFRESLVAWNEWKTELGNGGGHPEFEDLLIEGSEVSEQDFEENSDIAEA